MLAQVTIVGNIVLRFALYLDLMLAFGLPAFALYTFSPRSEHRRLALKVLIPVTACAGLALSIVGLVSTAAEMAGLPLTEVDWPTAATVITGTTAGTAWLVRIVALLAVIASAALARRGRSLSPLPTVICGAAALATLAWSGHGAADDGRVGIMHLLADVLHLLAAGVWVGALAGFLLMLRHLQPSDRAGLRDAHQALASFATTGSVAVSVIVATGLINSWLVVGLAQIGTIGSSTYGQLLIAKLVLFTGMLGLAAINRFRLTPAFAANAATHDAVSLLKSLRTSLVIEIALAIGILGLVAWLGILEPPLAA